MIIKIAIPGKMRFKLVKRERFLKKGQGDIHYIGGSEVLPPPLEAERENQVINALGTNHLVFSFCF